MAQYTAYIIDNWRKHIPLHVLPSQLSTLCEMRGGSEGTPLRVVSLHLN